MVAYYYPPYHVNASSLRSAKFAKYLPDFGWEPIVLTITPERQSRYTLPNEIKRGKVIRTKDFNIVSKAGRIFGLSEPSLNENPSNAIVGTYSMGRSVLSYVKEGIIWVLAQMPWYPDPQNGWYWIVRRETKKTKSPICESNVDALFTTSLPNTAHLIGRYLKQTLNVPWVADFRDPWTRSPLLHRVFPLSIGDYLLERWSISACDLITTVSEVWLDQLLRFHKKPGRVIPHGFDEEEYCEFETRSGNERINIVYTGTVTPGKQDPTLLFEAINALLDSGFIQRRDLEVNFYGPERGWVRGICPIRHRLQMEDIISYHGTISYAESVKKQMQADILLFLTWMDKRHKGYFTTKIYEYLGAGKPVLGIGPRESLVHDLLQETETGILVDSLTDMIEVLKAWITSRRQTGHIPYHGKRELIAKKYTRREQTRQLAELLDELVKE